MTISTLQFLRDFSAWLGDASDNLVARRIIWRKQIRSVEDFLALTGEEIGQIHGIGPLLLQRALVLQHVARLRLEESRVAPNMEEMERDLLQLLKEHPGVNPPYHNAKHMEGVWRIAKRLWEAEKEDIGLSDEWAEAALMFACLMHDFEHSGGQYPDSENVMVAREAVRNITHYPRFDFAPDVIRVIDDAIACTEFPFIHTPKNKLEEVLRDADMLYATCSGDPTVIMEDLRREIEVSMGRVVSYREMLDGQVKFAQSATMFTKAGQTLWSANLQNYVDAMTIYANQMDGGRVGCS